MDKHVMGEDTIRNLLEYNDLLKDKCLTGRQRIAALEAELNLQTKAAHKLGIQVLDLQAEVAQRDSALNNMAQKLTKAEQERDEAMRALRNSCKIVPSPLSRSADEEEVEVIVANTLNQARAEQAKEAEDARRNK